MGWASIVVAYIVGIYYNMINVYSGVYLKQVRIYNYNIFNIYLFCMFPFNYILEINKEVTYLCRI